MAHTDNDVITKNILPQPEEKEIPEPLNGSWLLKRTFIGIKELAALGLSNMGVALPDGFMGTFMMYFFTSVFKIDYRYISLMYLVVTVWDTMNVPVMGVIFDRTRTRFGKARPYLLFSPIPRSLCVAFLFLGPIFFSGTGLLDLRKIVYMFVTYFLWETFNTINSVPKGNLPLLMSPNPTDRNKIFGVSNLCIAIGSVLPNIILSPMIDMSKAGIISISVSTSFAIIGVCVAVLSAIFSLFAFFGTKERVMLIPKQPPVLQGVKYVLHNKPLLLQVLSGFMGCLNGIGGVYSNYFYIDVMGSATMSLVCGTISAVVSLASYNFIPWFYKHFTAKQLFFGFKIYHTIIKGFMFLIGRKFINNIPVLAGIVIVAQGLMSVIDGTNGVLNNELSADVQDYMEWQTGTRQEGTTGALAGVLLKFGVAISSSVGAIALSKVGYRQGAKVQTDAAKNRIFAMFAIIPHLLWLIGLIPWFFYTLWGDKRNKMRLELADMREARAKLYFVPEDTE